jgi:hypothetical protein
VIDGKLTFNTVGDYTVTMTNDAIISSSPAKVIVDIDVQNVSIDEKMENGEWRIYPNPTDGQLTIMNYELGITGIEVYDVMGRKVHQQTINHSYSVLELDGLPQGIYILKVHLENGDVVNRKIIKQ